MIKDRIILLLRYGLFWLLFFITQRLLFLIYNAGLTSQLSVWEVFQTFFSGFKLDLSLTGYFLWLIALMFGVLFFLSGKQLSKILLYFTVAFLIIFSIVAVVDFELYRNWGFRIDSTVLLYITTPKEAMASTKFWRIAVLVLLTILLVYGSLALYKQLVNRFAKNIKPAKWYSLPIFLIISGSMIIPMRGGFGIAPIYVGTVYFSSKQYANHAAINVQWNFFKSLLETKNIITVNYMPNQQAKEITEEILYADSQGMPKLTNNTRPNILILILESFSSRIVNSLGGISDVTPNIDSLVSEGILFTNFHANGDRSDKGIVAILSGYPCQPTTSIIKYNAKAEKLPHLSKKLMQRDYSSGFYYGGEINFANMHSYFVDGGYQNTVTLDEFSGNELNSKWGAHDHVVFNRLLNDLETTEEPFYNTFFTLSSHEPFDVPYKSIFNKNTEESKFLNSARYTDSCLGDFVQKAKKTHWYNNTLIFIMADHGGRWPGNIAYNAKEKFEIPLLIIGGALEKKDTVINEYMCQTDIAHLIGDQFEDSFEGFSFSKQNLESPFAFFAFNNGFGYFTSDSTGFIMENETGSILTKEPKTDSTLIKQGQAFMQNLLNDFNKK